MQVMKSKGVPVDNDAGMVEWYAGLSSAAQEKLGDVFVRKLFEARSKIEKDTGKPVTPDTDAEDFTQAYKPEVGNDKGSLADIKRQRSFYLFRLERARARGDRMVEAEAMKYFRSLSDLLHDAELRAQKLGRDLGESFSGEDVKRLGRAVGFWLMHGADELIGRAAKSLAEAPGQPLDVEGVRKIIEPLILAERVVAPMVRSTEQRAGVALPKLFVEAMREGLAGVVETDATK